LEQAFGVNQKESQTKKQHDGVLGGRVGKKRKFGKKKKSTNVPLSRSQRKPWGRGGITLEKNLEKSLDATLLQTENVEKKERKGESEKEKGFLFTKKFQVALG